MRVKKQSLLCAFLAVGFSLSAYADLTITNNTNTVATAQVGTICSSMIGEQGVILPKTSIVVPSIVFDLYCPTTCEAKMFKTKSCEGQSIATVSINHDIGVTSITNHNMDGYYLVGSGSILSIEGN